MDYEITTKYSYRGNYNCTDRVIRSRWIAIEDQGATMSKTHGLIPISNPDRSLPPRNPYPSLPINPSTIPKRPPIILIVKFHSIGATFTRHFVNGSFSKVDPLRIPYWNRKFARRIARFGTVLRGATRDARDKSARVQRGKRWTTVQGLFSPGRRRTLGGRDSLWWRRNRWTGRGTNPLDTRMERGETRRSQSGGEGTRKVGEKTSGGGSVIG